MPQLRPAPRYRSMLFVPGHKRDWMLKAIEYHADALIFDLEDAVPPAEKSAARATAGNVIATLHGRRAPALFVRANPWSSGQLLKDVEAVVQPGLAGVLLAKTASPEEVIALDLVLGQLEPSRGVEPGTIEIMPRCEEAYALYRTFDICMASSRVRRAGNLIVAVQGGDFTRSLGLRLDPDGADSLYFGTRAALDARAAGVTQILGGLSTNIRDLAAVRTLHGTARRFGATGAFAIHPSHIPILNDIYTPTDAEVSEATEVLRSMARAIARGDAAITHGEHMIDLPHIQSSIELLRLAAELGKTVDPIPDEILRSAIRPVGGPDRPI